MVWFRADDGLPENRKTRRAIEKNVAPMGLWVLAGTWSAGALTDGFVPLSISKRWDSRGTLAKILVASGFWIKAVHEGESGHQFLNWDEFQPTKAEVEADRAAARDRMKKRRAARRTGGTSDEGSADVQANTHRTNGEGTPAVHSPQPSPAQSQPSPAQSQPLNSAQVGRESHESIARGVEPPPRCSRHMNNPTTDPCIPCRAARIEHERWERDELRIQAEAKSERTRRAAEDRARAIADCSMCDDDGQFGRTICGHDPEAVERNRRGSAAVRAALSEAKANG